MQPGHQNSPLPKPVSVLNRTSSSRGPQRFFHDLSLRPLILLFFLGLVCAPWGHASEIPSAERLAIFISGLSGNHEFKTHFQDALKRMNEALLHKGYKKEEMVLFFEKPVKDSRWNHPQITNKENLLQFFDQLEKANHQYSEVFIYVIGHADGFDENAMFHLPGDDMSYSQLMKAMDKVQARQMIVVIAASQGEAWIQNFSRRSRILIIGSGNRQFDFIPLVFLRFFPESLEKAGLPIPQEQIEKNKEVPQFYPDSLFDAFFETQEKIIAWYRNNKLHKTEIAMLDGDGDKKAESFIQENAIILKDKVLASTDAQAAAMIKFNQGGMYEKHRN